MSEEQLSTTPPKRVRKSTARLSNEERQVKQAAFLEAYGECGVLKYAAKAAGVHRKTVEYWIEHDAEFKTQYLDAKADAVDTLEFAAYTQAVVGVDEPAISMGQVVYDYEPVLDKDGKQTYDDKGKPIMKRGKPVMIRKYSPQLLALLLKGNRPEKYRDKQDIDLTTHVGKMAEQAKDELLADLAASLANEDKDTTHSEQPDA